jgi:hypothetical protein
VIAGPPRPTHHVAIVVKPDNGSVFARALQRGIGTIVGVVLGAIILAAVPYAPCIGAVRRCSHCPLRTCRLVQPYSGQLNRLAPSLRPDLVPASQELVTPAG